MKEYAKQWYDSWRRCVEKHPGLDIAESFAVDELKRVKREFSKEESKVIGLDRVEVLSSAPAGTYQEYLFYASETYMSYSDVKDGVLTVKAKRGEFFPFIAFMEIMVLLEQNEVPKELIVYYDNGECEALRTLLRVVKRFNRGMVIQTRGFRND